jgi:hypothetical protein
MVPPSLITRRSFYVGVRKVTRKILSTKGVKTGEERDPLKERVGTTFESIRRQIEEGSGKVGTPPPPE